MPPTVLADLQTPGSDSLTIQWEFLTRRDGAVIVAMLGGVLLALGAWYAHLSWTLIGGTLAIPFVVAAAAPVYWYVTHWRLLSTIEANGNPYGYHVSSRYFCSYLASWRGGPEVYYVPIADVVGVQLCPVEFDNEESVTVTTMAALVVDRGAGPHYLLLREIREGLDAAGLADAVAGQLGTGCSVVETPIPRIDYTQI